MKILQVTGLGYLAGGVETSVRLIRDELTQRGHEVKILSSDIEGPEKFSDYEFKSISTDSWLKPLRHLFYFNSYKTLRRVIKDFQPDVIHFHTVALCSPSVFFAIGNIPAVMTIHGPEEFITGLMPWLLLPSDYRQVPFDLRFENLKMVGVARYAYYRFLQRPIYKMAIRRVKYFIAPSKYFANIIQRDFSPEKILQIYNGIQLPEAKPLRNDKRVLFVGRLEEVKGVEYLIRAFAGVVNKIPEAELYIVGDGGDRKKLEQLVVDMNLKNNVTFLGWIKSGPPILNEYENATLLVIPSIWPENLPTVCMEALAVGRPVIGTDTGGLPELIQDGQTGYIVPLRDEQAISKATIKILGDKEKMLAMNKNAAESAQRFSIARFADNIEQLYQKISNANSNR